MRTGYSVIECRVEVEGGDTMRMGYSVIECRVEVEGGDTMRTGYSAGWREGTL